MSVNIIDLASLTTAQGFKVLGAEAYDHIGYAVNTAGDVNNDGYVDIIIGALYASPNSKTHAGTSYVIYGSSSLGNIDLLNLNSSQGFAIYGAAVSDQSGDSVSTAGDINNDGYDDIIIGAPNVSPNSKTNAGTSYVIYGSSSLGNIDLLNLSSSQGFAIYGAVVSDWNGASVSTAGDVNNDGYVDIIIGSYGANPSSRTNAGTSYVIYGSSSLGNIDLLNLSSSQGFAIYGEAAHDYSGLPVSTAGDVNNDGYVDIIIGSYRANPSSRTNAGISYVIYGSSSLGNIDLLNLNSSQGFEIYGEAAYDYSGCSVSAAGDVNNDGFADIIIGALQADPNSRTDAGTSYVIYGSSSNPGTIDLSLALTSTQGFTIYGGASGDRSGRSISTAGDVNKDGYADIIIGSFLASPSSIANAGTSYVIYGSSSNPGTIDLSVALTSTQGFAIYGGAANDQSGFSVSFAGDVNKDGYDDLILGALNASPNLIQQTNAGKSYVIYGSGVNPTVQPTNKPSINPSAIPTAVPSSAPTAIPSATSSAPTAIPSSLPTTSPTIVPTTAAPTALPTALPTIVPTISPSVMPTAAPSNIPSLMPSSAPTFIPSTIPSSVPTTAPSELPTASPSVVPTAAPTALPTALPTVVPTVSPSVKPTAALSNIPSLMPSSAATVVPSVLPTVSPSSIPTSVPSVMPSSVHAVPSALQTAAPTIVSTLPPSVSPTSYSSSAPTTKTSIPSSMPVNKPTQNYINQPSHGHHAFSYPKNNKKKETKVLDKNVNYNKFNKVKSDSKASIKPNKFKKKDELAENKALKQDYKFESYKSLAQDNLKSSSKFQKKTKFDNNKVKNHQQNHKNSEIKYKNSFITKEINVDGGSKTLNKYKVKDSKYTKVNKKHPVGIALTDKEIELINYDLSKIKFDYYNNNQPFKTSWVSASDAILVYDNNSNEKVDKASEVVLTDWCLEAKTDFEALLCNFDTNKDQIFNSADQEFDKFYLWQDKNQDGISQDGELTGLEEAGILAIDFNTQEEIEGDLRELGALNKAMVVWSGGKVTYAYDLVFTHDVPSAPDIENAVNISANVCTTEYENRMVMDSELQGAKEAYIDPAFKSDFNIFSDVANTCYQSTDVSDYIAEEAGLIMDYVGEVNLREGA